ncbi:MAG TPA: tetratricopeptide repeat protein [Thermoanaerobaculia bacterium]|nr:tetratricopeptide repeat protein [Thermoanaerobaculia bacterium]
MERKHLGGPLVWLAMAAWLWASPAAWAQGSTLGLRAGEEIKPERIQELYRKILTDWSAGRTDQAPDELIELETAVVVDTDARTHRTLLKAEQEVIHQVGQADIEVLVPIAVLHHEAYRRLLARGGRGHALAMGHTRNMAKDLALLYQEQSGAEGAALVTSRLLTSLGGLLLQSAQQLPAAAMFQKAIELDGRNVPALLALSTVYEKNAQAESAVKLLRQALTAEPANAEARLRLALNLKRMEKAEESQKLLEGLAAEKEPSWVTPLAYQELARLASDRGRSSEAEKVLRQAIERFPGDLRLRIQLAAVLDRRGAPGEATALIEKAIESSSTGAKAGEASSARYLYNAVRADEFAQTRSYLDESSKSRLQTLAQALNAPPADAQTGTGVAR